MILRKLANALLRHMKLFQNSADPVVLGNRSTSRMLDRPVMYLTGLSNIRDVG